MDRALIVRRVLAVLAASIGVATIVAGALVLAGADPGCVVCRPLPWFNTAMGLAYLAAAAAVWRRSRLGRLAASTVLGLNLAALLWTAVQRADGAVVATASLRAMSLRAGVWLVILLALTWRARREAAAAHA